MVKLLIGLAILLALFGYGLVAASAIVDQRETYEAYERWEKEHKDKNSDH